MCPLLPVLCLPCGAERRWKCRWPTLRVPPFAGMKMRCLRAIRERLVTDRLQRPDCVESLPEGGHRDDLDAPVGGRDGVLVVALRHQKGVSAGLDRTHRFL